MENAGSLIFLVLLVAIFYFMLIRPQRKRVEEHRRLIDGLDLGDEIVTIGGLHGVIASIGDDDVELEVAPGTTLRFVKSAVARVVADDSEPVGDDDSTPGAVASGEMDEDERSS